MVDKEKPHDIQKVDLEIKRMQDHVSAKSVHDGPRKRGGGNEALRYVVEFSAAVGVGFFMGWYLDKVLDTTPWLMILFGILGFSAGVMNIYRAFQEKPLTNTSDDLDSRNL